MRRWLVLALLLMAPVAQADPGEIPPPPAPIPVEVSATEARTIVEGIFGCSTEAPRVTSTGYEFAIAGMVEKRLCPQEGIRNARCGTQPYVPSRVVVHRVAYDAAVSGHLAKNRVVPVDLFSDLVPMGDSCLVGFLVFPGSQIKASVRPAAGWTVSRFGRTVGLELRDVDRDGTLDLVHTYAQELSLGVRVVARDIWVAVDLKPIKLIAAGEKVSGAFVTTFEGFPLHEDREGGVVRGRYDWMEMDPEQAPLLLIQSVRLPWPEATWEFLLIGDLGDGWREILSGASEFESSGEDDWSDLDGPQRDCTPAETLLVLPFEARQRLMQIEATCRMGREDPENDASFPLLEGLRGFLKAAVFHEAGLHVVARAVAEDAAGELVVAAPGLWPVGAMTAFFTAWMAHRDYVGSHDARFGQAPEDLWDALVRPPLLWRLTLPPRALFIFLDGLRTAAPGPR